MRDSPVGSQTAFGLSLFRRVLWIGILRLRDVRSLNMSSSRPIGRILDPAETDEIALLFDWRSLRQCGLVFAGNVGGQFRVLSGFAITAGRPDSRSKCDE